MKFDFVAFLGGLTIGAATAALFSSLKGMPSIGYATVLSGNGVTSSTVSRKSIARNPLVMRPLIGRRGWL